MAHDPNDPLEIPITDVFDLHTIHPRDAKAAVEAYLEEAHRRGFRALRIIHGRGIGVQREMVRKVLASAPFVAAFADAPAEAGGWGATIVTLEGNGESMPKKPVVNQETESLESQYGETLANAEDMLSRLSQEQFNWRQTPGHWSVGQCLDHLVTSNRMYAAKISKVVEEGRSKSVLGEGPFRYGWLGRYLVRITEPPVQFKIKAPKRFQPNLPQYELAPTLAAYRDSNRAMVELVRQARGLDWKKLRVGSPATDLLKMPLGIAFALCVAHERRHLYQVKQILAADGFPR